MLKIAALPLDIYSDDDAVIAGVLPADAHTIKVADREVVEALEDHQFGLVIKTAGDVVRRRFPLHDADAVKLSTLYFERVKHLLPPHAVKVAEQKFANPASPEVAYVDLSNTPRPVKRASFAEQHWGLTIDNRNLFPLHDDTLVKTAIQRFPSTMIDLLPEERFLYARKIAARAAEVGVDVPVDSPVNLYTADEPNVMALKVAIANRKAAVDPTKISTLILDQVAEAAGCYPEKGGAEDEESWRGRLHKHASMQRLPAEKIIGVLQQFDKMAGFGDHYYLRGMLDPYAALFKMSAYTDTPNTVDGVDLSAVKAEDLKGRFDDTFIAQFINNPVATYRQLPDAMKAIVKQLATKAQGAKQKAPKPAPTVADQDEGDPTVLLAPQLANGSGSGLVY